jgi:hypothetical protein
MMSSEKWENIEVPKVLKILDFSEAGLSNIGAQQRLVSVGRNILAAEDRRKKTF